MQFPDMTTTLTAIRELAVPFWNFVYPILPLGLMVFVVVAVLLSLRRAILWGISRLSEFGHYDRSHLSLDRQGAHAAEILGIARRKKRISDELDEAARLHQLSSGFPYPSMQSSLMYSPRTGRTMRIREPRKQNDQLIV